MQWQHVVPDVVTCSALITVCQKGMRLEGALDVFQVMRQ